MTLFKLEVGIKVLKISVYRKDNILIRELLDSFVGLQEINILLAEI